jgi:hypothetical protein
MRWAGVFIVALPLLFLIKPAQADQTTLGEITRRCEQLESFWRAHPNSGGNISLPNDVNAAICYGYLLGIADLRGLLDNPDNAQCYQTKDGKVGGGCRVVLGFCFPKSASADQILAVFLAYARSHVAQWHEAAWVHVLNSMVTAFPCQYAD